MLCYQMLMQNKRIYSWQIHLKFIYCTDLEMYPFGCYIHCQNLIILLYCFRYRVYKSQWMEMVMGLNKVKTLSNLVSESRTTFIGNCNQNVLLNNVWYMYYIPHQPPTLSPIFTHPSSMPHRNQKQPRDRTKASSFTK